MEQTKIRESGCELLKIIGIILIVFSHVVQTLDNDFYTLLGFNDYHIKLSEPTTNIQILIIVLLRYAGIVGNWIFFMSSAWYLLDKKITNFKKVVRMLIEIFVISISFLGITLLFTDFNITDFYIKRSFFPTFFKNNWYTTYYIIFCFIFPILNKLIDLMNKKIHLIVSLILVTLYAVLAFYFYIPFEGYIKLWTSIYIMMAYFKKYRIKLFDNVTFNVILSFVFLTTHILVIVISNYVGLKNLDSNVSLIKWCDNYNVYLLVFSFGIFNIFKNFKFKNVFINTVSSLSLLVYILHENILFRTFYRPSIWQWLYKTFGYNYILILVVGFGVSLFLISIVVSYLYKVFIQKYLYFGCDFIYNILQKIFIYIKNKIGVFMKKVFKISCLFLFLFGAFLVSGCDHIHNYEEEVIDPTCEEEGYTIFTCSCGDTYKGAYSDPTHQYDEWVVIKDALPDAPGTKEASCKLCGHKITQQFTHQHEFLEIMLEPTCLEDGVKGTYCECGEEYIITTPALGHEYIEEVIDPTCSKAGYTKHTCTRCHDSYMDNYVEKEFHIYDSIVTLPTCSSKGYTTHICKNCSDSYIDSYVDELQHKFAADIILPSCKEEGYTLYTCDCGYSYMDNFTEKTEHNYGDWEILEPATGTTSGLKQKVCCCCGDVITEVIPATGVVSNVLVTLDLNGGFLNSSYKSTQELADDFIKDYNKYGNTNATIQNFSNDSTSSVKVSLANSQMLAKWKWLFEYMLQDLTKYNKEIGALSVGYVSDALDLLPLLIDGDTNVIKDSSKGPNFRTLIRGYLHGVMNSCKGGQNVTFAAYCPDFSDIDRQQALLQYQFSESFEVKVGDVLPIPTKENYIFSYWQDPNGNKTTTYNKAGTYKAIWDEGVRVEAITITNKISEINLFDSYQLTWLITPSDAVNKLVSFTSSNEKVLTIDRFGLITTHEAGVVTITIKSLALGGKSDSFTVSVVTPGYFDISYETNSYVSVGDTIKLNATYINPLNQLESVVWDSLTPDIASVDSDGNVVGVASGLATIRAYSINMKQYTDFVVTVVENEISEALELILNSHVSNIYTTYNLGIGAGTPVYYSDIFGSVSRLLFNKELEIDTTYQKATENKYGAELQNRLLESVEFITVHYTGGMTKGSTAKATAAYFAQPLSQVNTSIHYCTGNDGIYKGMEEIYRAAHAGDDGSLNTVSKFEWLDTPVRVKEGDPEIPVVSITKNATFSINGEDTGIKVPYKDQRGNEGYVTDDKWLNKMDLAVNIKDGMYQLGTAWWCYTQVWEGRICSNGGNRNSIGIESAVNEGSDLWLTWQITAMLVADIMERYDLDITRVKGHHFFSAKNCPQPMLENDLEIWYEFLELVRAEHAKLQLEGIKIDFKSNSDYVNNYGRITKQANESLVVTYDVTVTHNGKTETITLASIIEGNYVK